MRRGEIVGIAGLMGAGRTELARSVFGRSYGSRVEGTLRARRQGAAPASSVHAAIDAGIAYLTEDRKVLGLNLLDDIKRSDHLGRPGQAAQGPDGRPARGGRGRGEATAPA